MENFNRCNIVQGQIQMVGVNKRLGKYNNMNL